jgi:predicted TPR repeat methyltransferase
VKLFGLGRSLNQKVLGIKELLQYYYQHAYNEAIALWNKLHNLSNTNWQLALYHFDKINLDDAILRCRIVLFLAPKHYQALYLLGRCYYEKYKLTKSRFYLEKYLASPAQETRGETEYFLNIIRGEYDKIKEIPVSIVSNNFDRILDFLGAEVIENAGQTQHESAFALLNQKIQHTAKPLGNSLLDLGSGVGMFAILCREARIATNIVGVDFSPKMAEYTRQLVRDGVNVYTRVHQLPIKEFFEQKEDIKYDIISACDLFSYYPKLDEFFANIGKVVESSAWLVTSLKLSEGNEDIEFNESIEQFLFSKEYIIKKAQEYNWHLHGEENINYNDQLPGIVLIFSNNPAKIKVQNGG